MNFFNVSPSHGLQLFMRCSSVGPFIGCSPSGTDRSSVGPHGVTSPASKPALAWAPSLHGATGPARSLLQHGLPTGSQPPSGIPLLWREVLPRLQVESCSTMDLHGLQWDSLPPHGLLHGLQGNLCSGPWSTSSPSFCTDLGVASLAYSHSSVLLEDFFVLFSFLNTLS